MLDRYFPRTTATALALGLALVCNLPAVAQVPSSTGAGLPMSSGSGNSSETGSITGTGGNSDTGYGTTITGGPAGMRGARGFEYPVNPTVGAGWSPNFGPGGGSHFPDDPSLIPLDAFRDAGSGGAGKGAEGQVVTPDLLQVARTIDEPSERALALQNLAEAAIFTNQLDVAHVALKEAATTALGMPDSLVRDQRLIAVVTALINLAEADVREGKLDLSAIEADDNAKPLPQTDRHKLVRRAKLAWQRGAYVAGRIGNVTYRSEMLYRVVESASFGSEAIVNEYTPSPDEPHSPGEKTKAPAARDKDQSDGMKRFYKLADEILVQSTQDALFIQRPVWRDRALVTISTNAAGSQQFARALEIARLIPQPEVRTDALVKIAELEARGNRPKEATATYEEAARAVASIPLDDPRAVLTGVLIDNMITVGRFEDARKCTILYPDDARRYIALAAIAESQGRRGQSQAAMAWIEREVPQQHRSQLYRRVKEGFIEAIEQNRARALSNQGR
ncbi:MAG: hypothetical protein P4L84_20090 [Isosphaeraceae bacterium]|nr:hypothetical protein [Isosphaeraceae bacterium]